GWLALSFYLAFYLPVFVALTRIAVHRLGISIVLAAPVVWTGLELARGHLLGGFTMGSLAHTQIHWLSVIQGADIVGCYGISGLVMLIGACVARMIPWRSQRFEFWPIVPLAVALAVATGYGQWRTSGDYSLPGPKVALIQGSIDAELKADETMANKVLQEYLRLSLEALKQHPDLDLLVWPETMYRYPWFEFADQFSAPAEWTKTPHELLETSRKNLHDLQSYFGSIAAKKDTIDSASATGSSPPPPLLLGLA